MTAAYDPPTVPQPHSDQMQPGVALALVIAYGHLTSEIALAYAAAIANRDNTAGRALLAGLSAREISCVEAAVVEPELTMFRCAFAQATAHIGDGEVPAYDV